MSASRRDFLLAAAAAGSTAQSRATAAPKRPNVLFVFSDQQHARTVSAYRGTPVRTPSTDRLAAEGCRYDNAISIYPVCSPFRGMLMSGLYPMRSGVVDNDTPISDGLLTFGKAFRDAGYRTGYIGKWHLETTRAGFVPRARRQGFDDFWAVHSCNHEHFDSPYYRDDPGQELVHRGYEPDSQTALAIEFMRQSADSGRPFCVALSFGPPHTPYKAPREFETRFEPESDIPLPPNVNESAVVEELLRTDNRPIGRGERRTRLRVRKRLGNDHRIRTQILRGYYGACEALDVCVGRLLDTLDDLGIADNTIVVYTSDHGDMVGAHRMSSKQSPFEESVRVPFLLRALGRVEPGTVTTQFLTPVDILPTLLSLAGVPYDPKHFDGRDCSPTATEAHGSVPIMKMVHGGNPWIHNGIRPWRGIRTERFTYAELEGAPWLLFDNREDPYQMVNLIADPERAGVRQGLAKDARMWRERTGDVLPERQLVRFRREQRERY